jgi:CspA family cold shock protein
MSRRFRGTVVWFDQTPTKGYGFIALEGHKDVFVHYKQIVGEGYRYLLQGETVEFSIGPSPEDRRPEAKEVVVVRE